MKLVILLLDKTHKWDFSPPWVFRLLSYLIWTWMVTSGDAWNFPYLIRRSSRGRQQFKYLSLPLAATRREFCVASTAVATSVLSTATTNAPFSASIDLSFVAHAASSLSVSSSDVNVFSENKPFSVADAKSRFQAARKDLRYLLEHYSEISKQGGDAVRNCLGTQGINSSLYGIQKVLKILRDEADDLVEYTELMDEFNAYYYQAEGAAYQSLFVEHSSAKGTPESFLATAKEDIIRMEKYMDQLAVQLNL